MGVPTRGACLSLALIAAWACTAGTPRPETDGAPPVLDLREGATVSRTVHPGRPHVFPVPLEEGTYFEFHLDRDRGDVGAYVFEPRTPVDAASGSSYAFGEVSADLPGQVVWQVASATGEYHLRVESRAGVPVPYRLTVSTLRPATVRDLSRHRGLQVYDEAKRLWDEGRSEEALDRYLQARDLFDKGEYLRGVAVTYSRRGRILRSLKRWEEARAELQIAVEIWRSARDYSSVAYTLGNLADLARRTAQWERAEEYLDEAIDTARRWGAHAAEADTLNQYCTLCTDRGENERAIELCNRAVELQTELGEPGEAVGPLINLATVFYRYAGNLDSALDQLLRAQGILAEHPDPRLEATVRNELAFLFDQRGEYQEALEQYETALEGYEALREDFYAATVLFNMGTIHQRLGNLDATREYYQQALARMEEIEGTSLTRVHALLGLGWVYIQYEELERAEDLLDEALEIARDLDNEPLLAAALERMGELHVATGRPSEAISSLDEALALYRESGGSWREPSILVQLSRAHAALGDEERALEILFEAASEFRRIGRRSRVAATYHRIAEIERSRGNLAAARRAVEEAVAEADALRPNVGSEEYRTLFSATTRPYYELYVDILMEQHHRQPNGGHDGEALRESERARARSLLEILPESDLDLGEEVPEELLVERASIRRQLNDKELERQRLIRSADADPFTLNFELERLLIDLQEIERRIRNASPRYHALTRPEPVTVGEIRPLLDPETALLEYLLGERRSFLWVITENDFQTYELPPRQRLEEMARCVHWLITAHRERPAPADLDSEDVRCLGDDAESYGAALPDARVLEIRGHRKRTIERAFARQAQELSHALLGPPARDGLLPRRLAVVADGALEYVPFAALPTPRAGNDPLVVSHELVRLSSASVLAFQRRQALPSDSPSGELAIVADPVYSLTDTRVGAGESGQISDGGAVSHRAGEALPAFSRLPYSGREARAIAAFSTPPRTFLAQGFDANRETVTGGELSGYRYVHFATHGVIDTHYPKLSSLVLSLVDRNGAPDGNGFLRLHDIYGMDLEDADMVVLSACETALGQEIRGEGLVGLTRGFLYAGAERVVASLWQVQDRATADLMERFYHGILLEGRAPADALRQAQLAIRTSERGRLAFPYYWAGFVLQGEWR